MHPRGGEIGAEASDRPDVEKARSLLASGEPAELRSYLEAFHPSDLADLIESLDKGERASIISIMPDELASETLAEMEESAHPEDLLIADPRRVTELVRELSDDDAADIIGDLPVDKQREVLAQLPREEAGELRELLSYDEESAGGVMTTEVVAVPEGATVIEAVEEIKRQVAEGEDFYSVFVVDEGGRLRGTVSLQDLIIQPPEKPIREVTEPAFAVVPARMDQEDVARLMSRYNLVAVPVVDPVGRLIGRVTFDDVMDIIEAESTEDILRLAGGSAEEHLGGTAADAIKRRLPWLYVNMLTISIAALVVYVYQPTIQRAVVLVVFMPVIAALGGSAGTQALAVTVRRLALSPERKGAWNVVLKEVRVGVVNGAAVGLVAGLVGFFLDGGGFALGIVVMAALWLNLIVAGFAGAFVPVLLESLGADPAIASSVFVTAFTDLAGFFFLLALGSWMLNL